MVSGSPSRRVTGAIATATLGVYALVMAGATTTITDAAAACSTWPTCDGRWLVPLSDPRVVVAWGHRVAALLVGVVLLVALALALRSDARRRIRLALAAAAGLYPFQAALGAAVATSALSPALSGLHLGLGVTIFAALLLALAWALEGAADGASEAVPGGTDSEPPAPDEEPYRPPTSALGRLRATLVAYVRLTKPRLWWLLCLVAAAGMALAAGSSLSVRTVVATLGGGVLAIAASGTFNHVLERDVDRRMRRTADRPIATDRVGVRNALAFGAALTVASALAFASVNLLAAVLGLVAIAYYSVIYTLVLKPNTVQNTVIGGLAGSFPAVIGAAAATNTVGLPALALAAVIFLWTPAHFYNLALAYREDYERGGFPMLPVVHGEETTRRHVLLYLGATFAAAAALAAVSELGWAYAVTGVAFGAVFLRAVVRLHREPTRRAALRAFHASNAYLGALLIAVVVDALAV